MAAIIVLINALPYIFCSLDVDGQEPHFPFLLMAEEEQTMDLFSVFWVNC